MDKYLETTLKNIDDMPSLPVTVNKVIEVSRKPDATANELNTVISLDPVLAVKVLKLINSAYYGISNQVTSIVKAIIMLGINTIKNLALTTAIIPMMEEYAKALAKSPLHIEGFWKHSISVGVTAKKIAKHLKVDNKFVEEYFLAGLLHDISKLFLNINLPKKFLKAIKISEKKAVPLYIAEQKIIDISHSHINKFIAEKWGITGEIKAAMIYHHDNQFDITENVNITRAIHIADLFCNHNEFGFAGNRSPEAINKDLLNEMNMSLELLYSWKNEILQEIQKAQVFMSIK